MPQDLHVVKCYKCTTYQVHIVKKVKKWTCKMCGEKQSLTKVYGSGSGRDCRELVQRLNVASVSEAENSFIEEPVEKCLGVSQFKAQEAMKVSKWEEFMPTKDEEPSNNFDYNYEDLYINPTSDCEEKQNVYHMNKKRKVQQSGIKSLDQSQSTGSKWSEFLTDTDMSANLDATIKEEYIHNDATTPQLIYKNNLLCSTKQNTQQTNDAYSTHILDTVAINKFGNDIYKNKLNTIFQGNENDIDSVLEF